MSGELKDRRRDGAECVHSKPWKAAGDGIHYCGRRNFNLRPSLRRRGCLLLWNSFVSHFYKSPTQLNSTLVDAGSATEASCVFRKSSLDYGLRITAVIWDALGEWCVGHWRGCELVLTTRFICALGSDLSAFTFLWTFIILFASCELVFFVNGPALRFVWNCVLCHACVCGRRHPQTWTFCAIKIPRLIHI